MTRKNDYLDYILEQLSPFGNVTARSMFGGYGIYNHGLVFALIASDTLYFKVDDRNRPDYEAMGCGPFTYESKGKKATMASYYEVPIDILEDPDQLQIWVDKAYQASITAKKKAKK